MRQSLINKRAEFNFRKELAKQHFDNSSIFEEEYCQDEMHQVIKERIKTSVNDFRILQKQKILLSPFLEIGTGYGQSSLVLTNRYVTKGFALDIAIEPLKMITNVAKSFKMNKMPSLVVGDAERLPFSANSLPFIFTYQTVHHFPTPKILFAEVYRILSPGGSFFMAEEPIKQLINISFWRRPTKLRFWEKLLKYTLILPFISKIGKTEVDHGIIEGDFDVPEWLSSFEIYDYVEIEISPYPFGPKSSLTWKNKVWEKSIFTSITILITYLTGGGIKALAKKKGELKKYAIPPFACPKCRTILEFGRNKVYRCKNCGETYFKKGNISVLLTSKIRRLLNI